MKQEEKQERAHTQKKTYRKMLLWTKQKMRLRIICVSGSLTGYIWLYCFSVIVERVK